MSCGPVMAHTSCMQSEMRQASCSLLDAMAKESSWLTDGDKKFTKTDKKGISVIKKFYGTYYKNWSEKNEWSKIDKILTSKCINKLTALYPYEGNGIAMWAFWMLNTDEGEDAGSFVSRSIVPMGNGWFRVTNKHKNRSEVLRIRVIETRDGWKIDDVVNELVNP